MNLQEQCEFGQNQLMEMRYLEAQATLADAAEKAWNVGDFDTLSRVYMPLQEARRQRRQRAGEGIICLDLLTTSAESEPDPLSIAREIPHGQLLMAGWGNIRPALALRKLQTEQSQYSETFLAAVYPVNGQRLVVIVPLADATLPPAKNQSKDELIAALPPHGILMSPEELPAGRQHGTVQTYGYVMNLWERLHAPFLAAADAEADPLKRMLAYQKTIQVDYACEFAHQRLADTAKRISQRKTAKS
jgi:hypothetical protein